MSGDKGASVPDQALVASDGAASVSPLTGFDPSRMANGPLLWSAILAQMPAGSVVAGGAVRDYLLGYEPKDIDVFAPLPRISEGADALTECDLIDLSGDPRHGLLRIDCTHERYEEYAAFTDKVCVSSGQLLGWRVDAVDVDPFDGPAEIVAKFDFGITRCWFDGEQIHDTPEARNDRDDRCITLLVTDRVARAQARFDRLNERWGGGWTARFPAIATEARRAETLGSVHEGVGLQGIAHEVSAAPSLSSEGSTPATTGAGGDIGAGK